jgi:hypothetical protein
MPECEFIKRDGLRCGQPGVRGGVVCRKHTHSMGYKMCEGTCGKTVSLRHGRPKCSKCAPRAAKRHSDARLKAASPSTHKGTIVRLVDMLGDIETKKQELEDVIDDTADLIINPEMFRKLPNSHKVALASALELIQLGSDIEQDELEDDATAVAAELELYGR